MFAPRARAEGADARVGGTPLIFTANRDGDGVKAFEAKNHLNTTLYLELLSERGHDTLHSDKKKKKKKKIT